MSQFLLSIALVSFGVLMLSQVATARSYQQYEIIEHRLYECNSFRMTPPQTGFDRDPVVSSTVWIEHTRRGTNFQADHITLNGAIHQRASQYRYTRVWKDGSTFHWSGVWIRDTRITMVGSIRRVSDGYAFYVEQQYRDGQRQKVIEYRCQQPSDEHE
jgi:hypothetical protein